jgi:peroxiredoxin
MLRILRRFLGSTLLLGAVLWAQQFQLGSKVTDFNVQDLNGQTHAFSALKGNVTVVTFISVQCPVSNAYNDRMNDLYKDYSAKGVKFIFVNANRTEPPSIVAEHAKAVGFAFPVYKDPDNRLADSFNAQVTPESYVVDSTGTIRYHGSVDDSQNPARVRNRRLRQALDAVLSGAAVSVPETKTFGCSIKRGRKNT